MLLDNRDPEDDDNVCITAVLLDAGNRPALAYHANLHSAPLELASRYAALPAQGRWDSVRAVATGTKQCRLGSHQDDDVYAEVIRD